MKVSLAYDKVSKLKADLIVVSTRSARLGDGTVLDELSELLGDSVLARAIDADGFTGAEGQALRIAGQGKLGAKNLLLLGIGNGAVSTNDARIVAQRAVQMAKSASSIAVLLPESDADSIRVAAEGAFSGGYRYTTYKTGDRKPKSEVESVVLVATGRASAASNAALEEGLAVAGAVNLARDLVNAPPNDMNPIALAEAAKKAANARGLTVEVFGKKKLEKLGMDLFLAVNRGSAVEPRLVHIAYTPTKKAKKKIVFVGKGLTFDSGGLCIKPAGSMVTMKCDMAGAATTIGIVLAAADLGLPIEVHALIGCTDNMTGADAYRPGDVFKSLEGKTVEIINTDAEGRLVLADVLTYAARLEPDFMIDHATLTGACMVALGPFRAGFFANDEELASAYLAAAEHEGEAFHRLPLDEELRSMLDSDIADLKHVGGQHGGAITAALFLREFIGKTKWAHCDIAGPAFLDRSMGRYPKGGTGFGIATGVRFLKALGHSHGHAKK